VNNAKDFCQRAIKFHKAYIDVELSINAQSTALLSATVLPGTATSAVLRNVESASLQDSSGTWWPIEVWGYGRWQQHIAMRKEDAPSDIQPFLVLEGDKVFVYPYQTASHKVLMHGPQWLDDFAKTSTTGNNSSAVSNQLVTAAETFITKGVAVGDLVQNTTTGASALVTAVTSQTVLTLSSHIFTTTPQAYKVWYMSGTQTNFLVENCFDFLMFRSIAELNFFLKEDDRVQISAAVLDSYWNNVKMWNATVVENATNSSSLN
jgi:hypothetical protein